MYKNTILVNFFCLNEQSNNIKIEYCSIKFSLISCIKTLFYFTHHDLDLVKSYKFEMTSTV